MLDFLNLLRRHPDCCGKGAKPLTEYKIDADEEASRMAQRANGRRSVPQILLMVSTRWM